MVLLDELQRITVERFKCFQCAVCMLLLHQNRMLNHFDGDAGG